MSIAFKIQIHFIKFLVLILRVRPYVRSLMARVCMRVGLFVYETSLVFYHELSRIKPSDECLYQIL
jgi:hypothetical protein